MVARQLKSLGTPALGYFADHVLQGMRTSLGPYT
jgi:hypothetical protein